jgi:Protein of unknown function (DUF2796)
MTDPIHAKTTRARAIVALLSGLAALAAPAAVLAQAHVHGVARVDIVIDGPQLVVALESPLDSIVGFEHRPRTAAQRQAAEAAVLRLKDAAALWRPDAAAQCTLAEVTLQADALKPLEPAGKAAQGAPSTSADAGHADLDARYVFRCTAPERLLALEHGLFAAFKGMQRLELQIAGPKGQSRATLRRPATKVTLVAR